MTLLVADTSSLVSVGCAEQYDPSALTLLFDGFDVTVPRTVVDEIETLASYEHDHRQAAQAAETALDTAQIVSQLDISDSVPPLDPGERTAIALANEKHPKYLLCDEFTNLTLIASALNDTELLTTPALITAFVDTDILTKTDAQAQLSDIAAMRSWEGNAYYQRARRALDQL
jgi:predicted ribonuclease YlaK